MPALMHGLASSIRTMPATCPRSLAIQGSRRPSPNCVTARTTAQSGHITRLGSVMEDRFRARKVAAQAAPAPFWTRIPAIATYPLRGSRCTH
ncbi:Hypothetical Protein LMG19144_01798 [Xanthomonas arboricola pv. fragariae]|nr:Hypothetical Protein LMG19144_01798 [Xanthomonas arboricola pv. fragariae]